VASPIQADVGDNPTYKVGDIFRLNNTQGCFLDAARDGCGGPDAGVARSLRTSFRRWDLGGSSPCEGCRAARLWEVRASRLPCSPSLNRDGWRISLIVMRPDRRTIRRRSSSPWRPCLPRCDRPCACTRRCTCSPSSSPIGHGLRHLIGHIT